MVGTGVEEATKRMIAMAVQIHTALYTLGRLTCFVSAASAICFLNSACLEACISSIRCLTLDVWRSTLPATSFTQDFSVAVIAVLLNPWTHCLKAVSTTVLYSLQEER